MTNDAKTRREAFRIAILVVLLLSPLWVLITWYQASNAESARKKQISEILNLHRDSFEFTLRRITGELAQLHEFAKRHDKATPQEFDEAFTDFAIGLRADSGWVQAYQFIDNGIITHCYPKKTNEAVLGADLFQHRRRDVADDLRFVMDEGALSLTGPIQLMQGGIGIILRGPGATLSKPDRTVAIVVMLDQLLWETGLYTSHPTLECALRYHGALPFYGSPAVFVSNPQVVTFPALNKSLELAAAPMEGWHVAFRRSVVFFGGNGAAILVLAGFVTYAIALRQQSLTRRLQRRTDELSLAQKRLQRDVEILSETEAQLRFSETRFRAIFEQAALGVAIVEPQSGQFVKANESAAGILGCTDAELQGMRLSQIIHDEDLESCLESLESLLSGEVHEYSIEHRCIRRDGSVIWVNQTVSAITERSETGCLLIVLLEDIQHRKSTERRLQVLADSLPGLLMYIDWSLVIQFVNSMGEKWYAQGIGISPDEMLGQSLKNLMSEEQFEFASPWITRALNGETVEFTRPESAQRSGEIRYQSVTYAPHIAEDGSVPGFFALITDITERRKTELKRDELERQLLEAQKMEAVGTLAGGIAHDFNNMLQVILGYSEILLLQSFKQPSVHDQLISIQSAARRSSELTHQLLAFARRQSTSPVPVSLDDALPRMLRLMRRVVSEEIQIEWNASPDLWRVLIDPAQLDQIVANVIVNSRDAIDGPGTITLSAWNQPASAEQTLAAGEEPPEDCVIIQIADTGSGMDEATRKRIFEPFFTTKELGKGTGLGLSTVYGIVRQHAGSISVSSELGKGTVLEIRFPRCLKQDGERLQIPPNEDDEGTGTETILLVEDEPMVLELGKSLLERLGYRVIVAGSAEEAIRLSEDVIVHLLITDVVMPEMSGRELAEAVLRHQDDVRILFMSGYSSDIVQRGDKLEAQAAFLQKPFAPRDLAKLVRELLSTGNVISSDMSRT